MACLRGCIVTLVALVWRFSLVSLFLQEFLALQTKVIILTSLFHCVVFCPNGSFKLIQIDDWFLINNHFPVAYFHFLDKDKDTSPKKKSSLSSLILLTLVEFRLGTSWTINFLQNYHLYVYTWWECDCVIFPPFIIMTYSHQVGIWLVGICW